MENLGVPKFENKFSVPILYASVPKQETEVPIINAPLPALPYDKVPFGGEYDRESYREGPYRKSKTIQPL